MGFLHGGGDDVGNAGEGDAAFAEGEVGHFVGGVEKAGHVAALGCCLIGEAEAGEGVGVWFLEMEGAEAEEVKALRLEGEAPGVAEGVLDGEAHVGHAELGFDGSVGVLHGGMDDAFGMDHDFYFLGVDAEEPFGFNHFEAFVHEGCGVDGYLCAHCPVGVAEGLTGCDGFELALGVGAEGAAGGCQEEFFHFRLVLADETLEDGRVFAIDGEDGGAFFEGEARDVGSSHDEGFFVGQGDGFSGFDGADRWAEACKADHGGQHHIDFLALNDFGDGGLSGIDFHGEVGEGIGDLAVFAFIGDDDAVGEEFAGLTDE